MPRDNPSRQIRTRKSSFTTIRERFNSWRIKRLEGKLERKRENALTQGVTNKNYKEKLGERAEVIARLEEKIMILSKAKVPTDYVGRRAIKLRDKMIKNLTYNAGIYYTVGMENYEEVYALDDLLEEEEKAPVVEPQEVLAAAAAPSGEGDKINVVPSDLEREGIVDAINSSFDDLEKQAKEGADQPEIISAGDVEEVINEQLDKVDGKKAETAHAETPAGGTEVDKDQVREVVNEAFDNMEKEHAAEKTATATPVRQATVVPDAVREFREATTSELDDKVNEAIRKLRVSKNNTTAVKSTLFDENGNRIDRRKKYNYKPMTDEEIRQAQIKLGFDEHGNLISNKTPVVETTSTARVVGNYVAPGTTIPKVTLDDVFVPAEKKDAAVRVNPVVVPTRRPEPAMGLELEDGENMFEVIDDKDKKPEMEVVAPQEPVRDEATNMTIDDYNALREKILRLREQKNVTKQNRDAAERRAEEAAASAQEARKQYEVSQADFDARMERLRAYTQRLEADCDENVRQAEEANKSARESERIMQEQRNKADRNRRRIEEIDSMMGEVAPEEAAPVFGK